MPRLLAALAVSVVLGCASSRSQTTPDQPSAEAHPAHAGALAQIEGRSGSAMVGTARFTAAEGGVTVHLVVAGAPPGEHGVHVHEKGDCSDPKAASAGGHFNPAGAPHHGGPTGADRHGGDLGNITVDASGNGSFDETVPGLSIAGESTGIVGRAVVVHEKIDDLHSDPSGNSGARIGCGVITAEK